MRYHFGSNSSIVSVQAATFLPNGENVFPRGRWEPGHRPQRTNGTVIPEALHQSSLHQSYESIPDRPSTRGCPPQLWGRSWILLPQLPYTCYVGW